MENNNNIDKVVRFGSNRSSKLTKLGNRNNEKIERFIGEENSGKNGSDESSDINKNNE